MKDQAGVVGSLVPERVRVNVASEDEDTHCELSRYTIQVP